MVSLLELARPRNSRSRRIVVFNECIWGGITHVPNYLNRRWGSFLLNRFLLDEGSSFRKEVSHKLNQYVGLLFL